MDSLHIIYLIVILAVITLVVGVVATSVTQSGTESLLSAGEHKEYDFCTENPDLPECRLRNDVDCNTNPTAPGCPGHANVDCQQFPNAPGCSNVPTPPVNQDATLRTCTPADGQWSIPNADELGRSKLSSPCCQPPNYELPESYQTCGSKLNINDPIGKCVAHCCSFADAQAANYDPSWYPMARCACSMWCHNKDVPHFKKYGTAVHYITGDLAEARTSDSGDFIGGSGYDFSGL